MLRNIALFIAGAMFSATACAAASGISASNNQMGIQSISTNINYTEIGNGILGTPMGTLDTETGPVPGVAVYLSAMKDVVFGNDYFKATYDYSSGHTDYVGAAQGGAYGSVMQTSSAIFTNYNVRYGIGFVTQDSSMLTPYFEYGYHQWERGVNYGETYSNKYYGLGFLRQYALNRRFVLSVDAMYGRTRESFITINSGVGLTGFAGELGNSTLYKVGIALDYALSQRVHGHIGVDYSAFNYGISALYPAGGTSVVWEPNSSSNYATFKFGLGEEF